MLLIGCGTFGRVYAAALMTLGIPAVAYDVDAMAAATSGLPAVPTLAEGLATAAAALIATPVPTHYPLAVAVLQADRDLLLEKPATETLAQAQALAQLAAQRQRIVQVGLYFRFHPKAQALRRLIEEGAFGKLHYLAARFGGLKRARSDAGALLNDAVHFADLLPWLAGEAPHRVFATLADPLQRGREDLALLQLFFPSGLIGVIEAGCVLPGRWPDAVVAGGETRKELLVAGSAALAEIDFAAETFVLRRGAHRPCSDGVWVPQHDPPETVAAGAAAPAAIVAAEIAAFAQAVRFRQPAGPDLAEGAVKPARILEAARRSAAVGRPVAIEEIV